MSSSDIIIYACSPYFRKIQGKASPEGITVCSTSWKVSKYGVFLVLIFPYSVRIRENTDPKKLCVQHFLQCSTFSNYPFNDHCSHHIETSQLICRANQVTSFYMMGTLFVKRLTIIINISVIYMWHSARNSCLIFRWIINLL